MSWSPQSVPMTPGRARRADLLRQGALHGIALNCQGGVAYDRDMRRLVAAGMMRMERRSVTGGCRRSILVTTELGEAAMLAYGVDVDYDPAPIKWAWGAWTEPVEPRTVLVDGVRRRLHRLRTLNTPDGPATDGKGCYPFSGATLVVKDFSDGQVVLHWNPKDAWAIEDAILLPAGAIHRTGLGLVLRRYDLLRLPTPAGHVRISDEVAQALDRLGEVAAEPFELIWRESPHVVTRCAGDAVLARMLFPNGRTFRGFGPGADQEDAA